MGNGKEIEGEFLYNGQPMEKGIQEIQLRLKDVEEHYDQFIDADEVFKQLEGE